MADKSLCRRCWFAPARAKGLCQPCWAYKQRTGRDRPAEKIMRHVTRTIDAEQEAKAARRAREVAWEKEAPR
jgi:hypothetical protein